eukprot:CAMPEP_0117558740 /NCGR_PEP_ID=MMETSP0784-20121206/52998_1 /TAXON_ID=39447 /ORGANISM="" /LENGTH=291 /DNA_ID=CAMNT_0005356091 /DNA_START=47 /DNA_END=922 /DNA_ORIENTATION=+
MLWPRCCCTPDAFGDSEVVAVEELHAVLSNDAPPAVAKKAERKKPPKSEAATKENKVRWSPPDLETYPSLQHKDVEEKQELTIDEPAEDFVPAPTYEAPEPVEEVPPVEDVRNAKTATTQEAEPPRKVPAKKAAEPPKKDPSLLAKEKTAVADDLFAQKKYLEAVDVYTEALAIDKSCTAAQCGRGGCLLRLQRHNEALVDINAVLQQEPSNMLCLRDRAEIHTLLGNYDEAIADYNAKLSLAPADGRALCGRGQAKQSKGEKQGAIRDFEMAAKLGYGGASALLAAAKKG